MKYWLSPSLAQLTVLEFKASGNLKNKGLIVTLFTLSLSLGGILIPTMSPSWTEIGYEGVYS
jgi:hypothetical protein